MFGKIYFLILSIISKLGVQYRHRTEKDGLYMPRAPN